MRAREYDTSTRRPCAPGQRARSPRSGWLNKAPRHAGPAADRGRGATGRDREGASRAARGCRSWTNLPPRRRRGEIDPLFRLMARFEAEGVAIVHISHKLDEMERVTDEVGVMRVGRGPLRRTRGHARTDARADGGPDGGAGDVGTYSRPRTRPPRAGRRGRRCSARRAATGQLRCLHRPLSGPLVPPPHAAPYPAPRRLKFDPNTRMVRTEPWEPATTTHLSAGGSGASTHHRALDRTPPPPRTTS